MTAPAAIMNCLNKQRLEVDEHKKNRVLADTKTRFFYPLTSLFELRSRQICAATFPDESRKALA